MSQTNTIAIIGAMQEELEILKEQLVDLKTIQESAVIFYQGQLVGKNVVLALSGIGKVNAAMTTALVIEKFKPSYVINTGSAGGLGAKLAVGDVVVGNETAHHDVDVTAFDYVIGQVPQLPVRFIADEHLMFVAEKAIKAISHLKSKRGLIVSGDQFIDSQFKIATIKKHFPTVEATEMEAAAIAQVCHQLQTPFVVIRAISDAGDENASMSFDEFVKIAGKNSAIMVTEMVRQL